MTIKNMKRLVLPLCAALFVVACNNNSGSNTSADSAAGNPEVVQPPSEAIPDSTKIVNDSVIVPDTALKGGTGTTTDTTRH